MADTVKIKHSDDEGNDHLIINKTDFDPAKHDLYDDAQGTDDGPTDEARKYALDQDAMRTYEANRGIPSQPQINADGRNPSGTFSEPTPTDIRYTNKDATEFENNHGAFVNKSAADLRAELGLEDKPGGLIPAVHEAVQEAAATAVSVTDVATNAEAAAADQGEPVDRGDMTVPQLKEYAKANDIDLDGATTKADIRAVIDAAD
ncbi:MAG: hypothetical protein ABIO06_04670 [Pseudolysinimonas sp.]